MNFVQAVTSCLKLNYANFSGRASRSELWFFILFYCLAMIALGILSAIVHPAIYILALGLVIPGLAVQIRRLHDVGRSGWFIFINLVPIVGPLLLLYWAVQPSAPGSNQWGPSPLEGGMATGMPPAATI